MTQTSGFDGKAYTQFRPQHNIGFFKSVLDKAGLRAGNIIVDVGAGNGNSTIPLLELGYKVIAIECEPTMLQELQTAITGKSYANNLSVVSKNFETVTSSDITNAMGLLWESPSAKADAVFAASALHWLDRKIALPKIRNDILKPNGKVIGISRLMNPTDSVVAELHALLEENAPGYKNAETTFSPERWSNVEKQAKRYLENGFQTETLPEQRVFHNFDEFKGYLQTVSSLRQWLENMPLDSEPLKQLQNFYDKHAKEGILTLPWNYVACTGTIQQRTIADPFPPPSKHP